MYSHVNIRHIDAAQQFSNIPPIVVPLAGHPENPFAIEILTRVEVIDRIEAADIDPVPRFLDYQGRNEALFWDWCRDILTEINFAVAELPLRTLHSAAIDGEPVPSDDELLAAALYYASQGKPVFPVNPANKKPLISRDNDPKTGEPIDGTGWIKKATCDPDQIREWWARWQHAMIGMVTGEVSGVFVVDLDIGDKANGRETFKSLGLDELDTLGSFTPSGGVHLFFKHRDGLRNTVKKALGDGIDTRGERGYVIVPPSMRADGKRYEWRMDGAQSPAEIPQVILDKLEQHDRRHEVSDADGQQSVSERATAARQARRVNGDGRNRAYAEAALDAECAAVSSAVPTTRNSTLNNASLRLGQLVAGGELGETQVFDALYAAAIACGLLKDDGPKQVRDTIRSGMRAGLKQPRTAPEPDGRFARRKDNRNNNRAEPGTDDATAKAGAQEQPQPQPKSVNDADKPVIYCTGGTMHENAAAAEAALIAAGVPFYTRGNFIVMPISDEIDAARGGKTKVARVKKVDSDCMTDYLSRVAIFNKYDSRIEQFVPANPPPHIAKTILSRDGEWRFNPLAGVITTPTLRPNGSILSEPGYDTETKLLLMEPPVMRKIPDRPSRADAEASLALLNGLLDEFPFIDDASRAVALSGLITPVVRGAMNVAPLHAISAHAAGTGKSYLVELCHAIATGKSAPALAAGRNEEETEKRLVAAVIAGQSIISIDNLNGELGGDFLCQLVERTRVQPRVLGLSKLVEAECRATIFANGNNIAPSDDIVRRTLVCTLDANMERPELRPFKGNPLAAILSNRGEYIASALTIVCAFIAAGRPFQPPPLASYEEWTGMVRAPLMWLGCADPAKTQETSRTNDPVSLLFSTVMTELSNLLTSGVKMTAGEIKDAAEEKNDPDEQRYGVPTYKRQALRQVLLDAVGNRGEVDTRRLGKMLSKFNGRIIDGYKLYGTYSTDRKQMVWSIITGRAG